MKASGLTPDLAPADLTAWRLILKVSPEAVSALILGPDGPERAVIAHQEPLADDTLEALENAIYDNPLLLSDFGRVDILLATSQRVMIPSGLPAELDEEILQTMLPDSDGPRRIITSPMGGDARIAIALPAEMFSFLQRTFPDGTFSVAMEVLASAAQRIRPADKPVNVAITEPGELSMVCLDAEGRLTFANRFEASCAADCAYFILAALGPDADSLMIGGNADLRNETIEQLRPAAPDLEPTPLFLSPEISQLRRRADFIPLDLFFATEI